MKKWRPPYPDWLYRALPHVYVWLGLLILIPLPGALTVFSSAILISTGLMVWANRYRYRRAFSASRGSINVLDWSDADTPTDGSLQISWRSSFECGHPILDAQHRRLFGIGNELVRAVASNQTKVEMELLIEHFFNHLKSHLETESLILSQSKIPELKDWQKRRNFLWFKAKQTLKSFHLDELSPRELAGFVTYDVVVEHILKGDIKLGNPRKRSSRSMRPLKRVGHRNSSRSGHETTGHTGTDVAPDSIWGETYFR